MNDVSKSDWIYRACRIDAAAGMFGPFATVVRKWQDRIPPDQKIPKYRSLDFYDVPEWLGRVFIAKVEHDPFNLRFVLWGTLLVDWWGVDYTGRKLGENSQQPEIWQDTEIAYFTEMERSPFVGIASGLLSQHNRPHNCVLALDLPFSDGDGLSHIMSFHLLVRPHQTVQSILSNCQFDKEFSIETEAQNSQALENLA